MLAARFPVLRNFVLQPPFHPTTFLERGVAVSFTTPSLAGARVRKSERSGLELIVHNPAGGRGFYVIPWKNISDLFRATLHDRELQQRTCSLPCVTPHAMRQIAFTVAREGYAGREARTAAARAQEQDRQAQLATHYFLLVMLIAQVEGGTPDLSDKVNLSLERSAKRAVARIAPALGDSAAAIGASMEDMASVFTGVGLGPCAATALQPRVLKRLVTLRDELAAWSADHYGEAGDMGELIVVTADLTIACTDLAISEARAMLGDLPSLVARWRVRPDPIAALASRPDLLLDGWDPVCSMWETSSGRPQERHAAVAEMVGQIPIMPKEVGAWFGHSVELTSVNLFRRWTELNKDWRTGLPFLEALQRREQMRTLAT